MTKKHYTIMLDKGKDQQRFVDSVAHPEHFQCINSCDYVPQVFIAEISESYAEELKNHSWVKEIVEERPAVPVSLPEMFQTTKTFVGASPSIANSGTNYGPLTFYYFNNQISSGGSNIGTHPSDNFNSISGTYSSYWTGKDVDIVTLEVPGGTLYNNYQTTHPDFRKVSDPATTKIIPENWQHDSLSYNQQLTTSSYMTSHAIGVLSAAGGTYCGYAKNANLRVIYLTSSVSSVNEVIRWHNSKAVNPTTGVKNPTILIHEYQYLASNSSFVKISDINQIKWYDESGNYTTVNRPVGGWGNDLTPFVSRNFNVKRVNLPTVGYTWCIVVPGTSFSSIISAIDAAVDAGITSICAAGNDAGIFVKASDPRANSTIVVDSGATITYNTGFTSIGFASYTSSGEEFAPLAPYGPNGSSLGIDVAAGQNSDSYPVLDSYSTRGPGADITGMGARTWTAYPVTVYSGGHRWGFFSGTSCATPTVAGVLACLMEKYRYYTGSWPTPAQAKDMLFSESEKGILYAVTATNWSSAPPATTAIPATQFYYGTDNNNLSIFSGQGTNGGIASNELTGTPNRRAFIDGSVNRSGVNYGTRPASGALYPRTKRKINS